MVRRYGGRRRPERRSTEASRALLEARHAARLGLVDVARALGVDPRTIRRWELGESRPREPHWPRLIAFYAERAPAMAATLAAHVGRTPPATASTLAADSHAAMRVLATTADALDIAPKRVREVLRAIAAAAAEVGIGLDRVAGAIGDGDALGPLHGVERSRESADA